MPSNLLSLVLVQHICPAAGAAVHTAVHGYRDDNNDVFEYDDDDDDDKKMTAIGDD